MEQHYHSQWRRSSINILSRTHQRLHIGTEFRGVTTFDTQGYFVPPSGTTEQRGNECSWSFWWWKKILHIMTINYITISSMGNAQDFGNLTHSKRIFCNLLIKNSWCYLRVVYAPGIEDTIQFITIATTGNALDFGELTNGTIWAWEFLFKYSWCIWWWIITRSKYVM